MDGIPYDKNCRRTNKKNVHACTFFVSWQCRLWQLTFGRLRLRVQLPTCQIQHTYNTIVQILFSFTDSFEETMLAGTPSSLAAGSFPPMMQPPSQSFLAKIQPPILPPNFPRNPQQMGQPPISSDPSSSNQPMHPPLNGSPIQHTFPSQLPTIDNRMSILSTSPY